MTEQALGKQAAVTTLLEVGATAIRTLLGVDEITAAPRLFRYRIDGGQFVECWLYDEDQALIDRLWA